VDESSPAELENFVDEDHGHREDHDPDPIVLCERNDTENLIADGDVEDDEMDGHGKHAGEDQPGILPRGHGEEGSVLRKSVEGIEHLDHNQYCKRQCGGFDLAG